MRIGETFKDGRYVVLSKLGWGHFSTVWLVADTVTGTRGALKVVKSASHYTEAARDEVRLLSCAKERDPNDMQHCCRLLDHFEHSGPHGRHVCMVFEVLGDNLLSLIREYSHRGIPIPVVRHLTRQVLVALNFLHTVCGIIHTDLKPENVMLKEPVKDRPRTKLVGSNGGDDGPSTKPVGKIAQALAAGQQLTKNQKKKLRKKLQKETTNQIESTVIVSEGDGSSVLEDKHSPAPADGMDEVSSDPNMGNFSGENEGEPLIDRLLKMTCKVVDFGNACWVNEHFTDDIQTRQYRAPEVRNFLSSPSLRYLKAIWYLGCINIVCAAFVCYGRNCPEGKLRRASVRLLSFCTTSSFSTFSVLQLQVILGSRYGTSADIWSLACMVFELTTGDFLFEPRAGRDYSRDEDHLAQMIELLGRMPRSVATGGRYSRDFCNRDGQLRHIQRLNFWPLERVLEEKYGLKRAEVGRTAN